MRNRANFNHEWSGCKEGGRELIRFLSNCREITARKVGVSETTEESAVVKFHLQSWTKEVQVGISCDRKENIYSDEMKS